MEKHRLLAMTDGVVAIIITIMVLELKAPEGTSPHDLIAQWPAFLAYGFSFGYVAIYWNNHHHYFHLVKRIDGAVLWANFALLFWLSLVPFATAWAGEHGFAPFPTAIYGVSLFLPAIAWRAMQAVVIRADGGPAHSALGALLGRDAKSAISPLIYMTGIGLSFVAPWAGMLCYLAVALLWVVPDRRIERIAEPH
jgi:uncharacterized membrane protein